MDESGSSQGQRPPWTGMKRSDKGALGRVWAKIDAGEIRLETMPTTGASVTRNWALQSDELGSHEPPHQVPVHTSPIAHRQRQSYGKRLLPPREAVSTTPTTPRTPRPSSSLPQPNDYIPTLNPSPDWNRMLPTTSRDPRLPPNEPNAIPIDDETFMMNMSPMFNNSSCGLGRQPDGVNSQPMEDVSPSPPASRAPPIISRPSVELPSPRSQPYPHISPVRHYERAESSLGGPSCVTGDESRKVFITPRLPSGFAPANHGIDIGFQCMAKHWVAGWTTMQHIPQWGKDQWFEEFKCKATWKAEDTPDIQRIFFVKCRDKLNNGWYNLRHSRCKEGLRFLKRHEVDLGLVWYIKHADEIDKISQRNILNSKDIAARIHRGGSKGTDVIYTELEASLERVVYCADMWDRVKKRPNGSYLDEDAAEKAGLLKTAHDALLRDYDGPVPQAVDFEVGSKIIGLNKRTKLPKIIGTAATLVEGTSFNLIASRRTSSTPPCPQLTAMAEQLTQLQQQQQQMMQLYQQQQQQQQHMMNLTQALLKANTSQPQRPEEDEDEQSTD